jgi:hypothetical protein
MPDDLPLHHYPKPASDIGQTARSPILKPALDVTLPKIRWLKNMKVRIYRLEPILSHLSTPLHKSYAGGFSKEHLGQSSASGLVHCPQNFIPSGLSQPQLEQRIPKP